ncbi:MAG: VWA domain-containing protein [Acidobacteria bacterium]|nr:VWA domain-containing protein [Acidobacteriota bacterium]
MAELSSGAPAPATRFLSLVLAASLASGPLGAADPPKGQAPAGSFKQSFDLSVTNLDVIVTDSKGNRVTGLTKNDFVVVEDGMDQLITNFFAVDGGRVVFLGDEPVPPPPPNAKPEEIEAATPMPLPKTRLIIFVDSLHSAPFNRNRVLRNVEEWVRTTVKGDVEGMVVTWNRSLKTRQKFTTEGRQLSDVLKQLEEESALGTQRLSERRDVIDYIDQDSTSPEMAASRVRSYAQSLNNDLQFTFDALKSTIQQLSGVEGRKMLLHVSDGLPQAPGQELWRYIQDRHNNSASFMGMGFEFDKTASYMGIVREANAAGVSLYFFDASGLSVDSGVSAENRTQKARIDTFVERNNEQSMLQLMAEETGGLAILNRNDISLPLKEVEKDFTSYYSIGYRSLRSGADRPHKVEVKAKKKGLVVRARRSYVEKSADTKIAEAVTSALFFPKEDNPLGAAIETGTPAASDRDHYVVPVKIRVPYSRITLLPEGEKSRGRLMFYFAVLDSNGKQSDLATQALPVEVETSRLPALSRYDFVYDVKLLMVPGGQRLSVAVRDEITNTVSYVQKQVFVSALGEGGRR